ncbi:MAG: N(4)-(beta-N-acetylglucosaminyl)-L-asparaginase [Acidobacteriota bacterium]
MSSLWSRRGVLRAGVATGLGWLGSRKAAAAPGPAVHTRWSEGRRPLVISSRNGTRACKKAMSMLLAGEDTLEAAIAGVNLVEEDPDDMSVGYGGLPNEEGVVQLDSSVMHGPTRNGGAVAALEGIKTPSRVAKLVMERTDHVLLVGKGAQDFARYHGFEIENLLTDRARERWLRWKENLSDRDDWLPPKHETGNETRAEADEFDPFFRHYGTINCNCLNANGDISGVTTTSGLSWKLPGRVGDSPILGAGLYVDNDVGACGSTGRGEANLLDCCSFLVVELMRQGKHPKDACIEVLKRVAHKTIDPRLLRGDGTPAFGLSFYALNKNGEYAGANFRPSRFAVNGGGESRIEDSVYIWERIERK